MRKFAEFDLAGNLFYFEKEKNKVFEIVFFLFFGLKLTF